ncbi:TPA: hypothetical protein ACH3X1_003849 [Trebouxia sp. C0004]
MAKRKRQVRSEAQADPSDKARKFTDKLANLLVSGAHGPIQEGKIGEALAAAVSQLPANRPVCQLLQQYLAQYTQLLSAKLVELQSAEEPQLAKKHKTALPNRPEAQCLSVLCHRSCQTIQEKILRCQQILAACVNVIPAGIVQQEPGLTVALDAIRDTLQELCSSAAGANSRATQAKLLQPAVAQLTTIVMLASQRDSSDRRASGQAHMSPADLQHAASEVTLLALEMRCVMAKQSIQLFRQVLLAAHDIKTLTGSHTDAVFDMLLRETFPCVSSSSPEATCILWEIVYKAALQVKPPGHSESDFLLRMAAAEKACSMMPASKSQILGSFDRILAPVSFCTWLQRQPRSLVVQGCLDALKHSPLQLTQHLLARQEHC